MSFLIDLNKISIKELTIEGSPGKSLDHLTWNEPSVVSKVFEKIENNRIVNQLEKNGLFSDFQYGFRFPRSTEDLLTVVSDTFARTFNRSGATRAVALIYPRLLTGFDMLVFFINLSLMEFQFKYLVLFLLFSVIDGIEWFWMENVHKNIQLSWSSSRLLSWSYTFSGIH